MKTIDESDLATVVGGMRWEDFRRSTHVEDRRPAWVKQRDEAWFSGQEQRESHQPLHVPLPPRRPAGT